MTLAYNRHEELEKRRSLRRQSPETERRLWKALRGRQLEGFKFGRQYSVGPYVLDFYCPALKLALEADGPTHDSLDAQEYDTERQHYIEAHGIRFLRFTNAQIRDQPDQVLSLILTTARSIISPSPC